MPVTVHHHRIDELTGCGRGAVTTYADADSVQQDADGALLVQKSTVFGATGILTLALHAAGTWTDASLDGQPSPFTNVDPGETIAEAGRRLGAMPIGDACLGGVISVGKLSFGAPSPRKLDPWDKAERATLGVTEETVADRVGVPDSEYPTRTHLRAAYQAGAGDVLRRWDMPVGAGA